MPEGTIHDWLRSRLATLVREAVAAGFDPQAVVATLIDLAEDENFAAAPPRAPGEADPGA